MSNDSKYEKALTAIMELFADQSFTVDEAIQNLYGLRAEIDIMLDALE